jgi:hypothetical protein
MMIAKQCRVRLRTRAQRCASAPYNLRTQNHLAIPPGNSVGRANGQRSSRWVPVSLPLAGTKTCSPYEMTVCMKVSHA